MLYSSPAEIKWGNGPLKFFACFYSKEQRGQCHLQGFNLGLCLWVGRVGLDSDVILPELQEGRENVQVYHLWVPWKGIFDSSIILKVSFAHAPLHSPHSCGLCIYQSWVCFPCPDFFFLCTGYIYSTDVSHVYYWLILSFRKQKPVLIFN